MCRNSMQISLLPLLTRFAKYKQFFGTVNHLIESCEMNLLQMCGPTGIGFLYGKSKILSAMPPFLGMHVNTVCACVV